MWLCCNALLCTRLLRLCLTEWCGLYVSCLDAGRLTDCRCVVGRRYRYYAGRLGRVLWVDELVGCIIFDYAFWRIYCLHVAIVLLVMYLILWGVVALGSELRQFVFCAEDVCCAWVIALATEGDYLATVIVLLDVAFLFGFSNKFTLGAWYALLVMCRCGVVAVRLVCVYACYFALFCMLCVLELIVATVHWWFLDLRNLVLCVIISPRVNYFDLLTEGLALNMGYGSVCNCLQPTKEFLLLCLGICGLMVDVCALIVNLCQAWIVSIWLRVYAVHARVNISAGVVVTYINVIAWEFILLLLNYYSGVLVVYWYLWTLYLFCILLLGGFMLIVLWLWLYLYVGLFVELVELIGGLYVRGCKPLSDSIHGFNCLFCVARVVVVKSLGVCASNGNCYSGWWSTLFDVLVVSLCFTMSGGVWLYVLSCEHVIIGFAFICFYYVQLFAGRPEVCTIWLSGWTTYVGWYRTCTVNWFGVEGFVLGFLYVVSSFVMRYLLQVVRFDGVAP
eukprot:gene13099-8945_t